MKPITINLSIADALLITTGLTHIIENSNYHELDRELAEKLRKKIRDETRKQRGRIERGD
jgi:hypothetical protein